MVETDATQIPIGGIMLLNTKEDWQPEEADVIAWQRAYPAINVHQELAAMESWCDANPTKRKTSKGIKRFVNSWLSRAQDRGGSPQAKSATKSDSIRAKTIDMQLTDISWLDGEDYEKMKQYYLETRGFYYDGGLING
jgi:cytoskeletal protein RodZ